MRIVSLIQRELRLNDNPLFEGADAHEIIPLFVRDDAGDSDSNVDRAGLFSFALAELARGITNLGGRLYCLAPADVDPFLALARPDLVRLCEDIEPGARERNLRFIQLLERRGIRYHIQRDHTLSPLPSEAFTTFAGFYQRHFRPSLAQGVPSYPAPRRFKTPTLGVTEAALPSINVPNAKNWFRTESEVLDAWERFVERRLTTYAECLDFPSAEATSAMSPYLRCGMISLGRMFRDARDYGEAFTRNLARNDYFTQLLEHFPRTTEDALDPAWWHFPWQHNPDTFRRWQQGETGFPLVDAGMRQLHEEGWMDHRIRMVVASFLTRNLRIDWRWGDRDFARRLIDASPALNVGNWQWVTGCGGPDSIHYFRVLNPLIQAQRFDPDGSYTRRYLPALRDVPVADLTHLNRLQRLVPSYPPPMVDLAETRRTFIAIARGEIRRAKGA